VLIAPVQFWAASHTQASGTDRHFLMAHFLQRARVLTSSRRSPPAR